VMPPSRRSVAVAVERLEYQRAAGMTAGFVGLHQSQGRSRCPPNAMLNWDPGEIHSRAHPRSGHRVSADSMISTLHVIRGALPAIVGV